MSENNNDNVSGLTELRAIIDDHNAKTIVEIYEDEPQQIESNPEIDELLAGFAFPATKGMGRITIGKRNRLYLKGKDVLVGILGIKPQTRIIIGYNVVEDAFAIVKPEAIRYNREAQAAGYFVSLRYDVTAAKMFRQYNLDKYEGQTYYFDKASSDASVAIFRRY